MSVEINQSLSYERPCSSILDIWESNLIDLEPIWVSSLMINIRRKITCLRAWNSMNLRNMNVELEESWVFFSNLKPMSVEINQSWAYWRRELNWSWAYECRILSILCLWASNLPNLMHVTVHVLQFWAYQRRTWLILGLRMWNLTDLGRGSAQLDQSWASELPNWSVLNMCVAILITVAKMKMLLITGFEIQMGTAERVFCSEFEFQLSDWRERERERESCRTVWFIRQCYRFKS